MYPRSKDLNAVVVVCDRATGKALEGADRQTDRQTVFPPIIVRWQLTAWAIAHFNTKYALLLDLC